MQRTPRSASDRAQKRQETPRRTKLANAAIGGMGVLLIAGLGVAFMQNEQAEARSAEAASTYTAPVAAPSAETRTWAPVDEAVARLEDESKPWTLTVLGDSTGAPEDSWVYRTVETVASETGRPATIHAWNIDKDAYDKTTEIAGDGEPIIVWNGSASGERAAYTYEHREAIAPEPSDLVIINHGHNHSSGTQAASEVGSVTDWVKAQGDAAPALAVTLQNPQSGETADRHEKVVGSLENAWDGRGKVALIDVHTAFVDADDMGALLRDDNLHPSPDGQKLWADTVQSALNLP